MKSLARALARGFKRAAGREDGSATIEFVILFPAIMTIFFSSFEVAIWLTREVLLDRALDLNVRALRLGTLEPATQEELQRRVCNDALIFANCPTSIRIELTRVSTTNWQLPTTNITCVNRDEEIQPAVEFDLGTINDLMVVRACAVLDPIFPSTPLVMDLPLDPTGGYIVAAVSTFVNEP
jgi:Flp pilus assembly protein TadG